MSLKKRRFKVRWMTWRKSSARPYPRAGEQNSFTIQARDKFQNKKMFGGESFVADFTQSGTTTTVNALDNNDGTYTVQYTLTGSGYYTIKLSHPLKAGFFQQVPLRNVMLRTSPAPIGLKSYADGAGLDSNPDTCTAGAYTLSRFSSTSAVCDTQKHLRHPKYPLTPP